MRDQDKTKVQLIADLEKLRSQLAKFEQAECRRNAALRLLSELPKMVEDHGFCTGTWDWEPHKDKEVIAFYPMASATKKVSEEFLEEDPDWGTVIHPIFDGKWEEIVRSDDLNSLKKDLNSIIAGKETYERCGIISQNCLGGRR